MADIHTTLGMGIKRSSSNMTGYVYDVTCMIITITILLPEISLFLNSCHHQQNLEIL